MDGCQNTTRCEDEWIDPEDLSFEDLYEVIDIAETEWKKEIGFEYDEWLKDASIYDWTIFR